MTPLGDLDERDLDERDLDERDLDERDLDEKAARLVQRQQSRVVYVEKRPMQPQLPCPFQRHETPMGAKIFGFRSD